jgi:protein-disulfide isomerase
MTNEINNNQTSESETQNQMQNNVGTPIAIVIAALIIGAAIYVSGGKAPIQVPANNADTAQASASLDKMAPVTAADHIFGNSNAPVKIVEYSDTECPFCKQFHQTLTQVMNDPAYGAAGKVAWVYRDFPLASLHPRSPKEAEAMECANAQGGNDKFWAFMNRIMEVTPSNNGLDPTQLPVIAQYVGLDVAKFNTCLSSGTFTAKVNSMIQEAVSTGGNGTPWSIVVGPTGKKFPLSGSQSPQAVKALIDQAAASK